MGLYPDHSFNFFGIGLSGALDTKVVSLGFQAYTGHVAHFLQAMDILIVAGEQNPWLQLTNFTDHGKKMLAYTYNFISVTSSSILYFVVAIWLLVYFRVEDLKGQNEPTDKKLSHVWPFSKLGGHTWLNV